MKEAEHHNSFFFAHKKIKNLKELLDALINPEYLETAKSHVTENRNDYANWIKDVLKEDELSLKISKEKEIPVIADLIKKRIEEENNQYLVKTDDNPIALNTETKKQEELEKDAKSNNETAELDKVKESRHFCPKFFECMKKEFLFGFTLGIIVGIVIAVFIKIGAI